MTAKTIEYLNAPQIIRVSQLEGKRERRVSNWITTWDLEETIDVGILGVPLVKGIRQGGSHETLRVRPHVDHRLRVPSRRKAYPVR